MCFVHGLIKGFWWNKPWFNNCQVRGWWFFTRCFSVHEQLFNSKQRVRINSNLSTWENITAGVPQGSILASLLFNIFINDLFLFVSNSHLSNYANQDLISKWFEENYMVLNADKCHFMCFGKDTENEQLTMNIDKKLTFKSHIKILCRKAAQKIRALSRLLNHLSDSQKRLIFNSIIKSQFNYCPLTWIFCSRTTNMIKIMHERSLRLILNDHTKDFDWKIT